MWCCTWGIASERAGDNYGIDGEQLLQLTACKFSLDRGAVAAGVFAPVGDHKALRAYFVERRKVGRLSLVGLENVAHGLAQIFPGASV